MTTLAYELKYSTPDMPQSKYVLAGVTRSDESGKNGLLVPDYESEHSYTVHYSYEDGYYNRVEKESYGFATVTVTNPVDNTVQVTRNKQNVYRLKGMPESQSAYSAEGGWRKETLYTYINENNPAETRALTVTTQNTVTEGDTLRSWLYYDYDGYGNVTAIRDAAEGVPELTAVIEYWHNESAYLHAHPKSIVVSSGGTTIRRREGSYDNTTGALIRQTAYDGSYDDQDRPVTVRLPDASIQRTAYTIQSGKMVVTATDPLGNKSVRENDIRGNIVAVRSLDTNNSLLTQAQYDYNAIGEMTKAIDPEGSELKVEYDWMGRRTAMESRDIGRKEYDYDARGNLSRESDSVLRGKGTFMFTTA